MDRTKLVDRYLAARAEKKALAEEFKAKLEPLCAEIKALEAQARRLRELRWRLPRGADQAEAHARSLTPPQERQGCPQTDPSSTLAI